MNKKLIIILILVLVVSYVALVEIDNYFNGSLHDMPRNMESLNYETWGNNEHWYSHPDGYDVKCEIRLFQTPGSCEAIDENGVIVDTKTGLGNWNGVKWLFDPDFCAEQGGIWNNTASGCYGLYDICEKDGGIPRFLKNSLAFPDLEENKPIGYLMDCYKEFGMIVDTDLYEPELTIDEMISNFQSDLLYVEENTNYGFTGREYYTVMRLANDDLDRAVEIFNDPNYPESVYGKYSEEPNCGPNTFLNEMGVCQVIYDGCKPDAYGNMYDCMPQYDYLNILFSSPIAMLVVFGTLSIIIGIPIIVIYYIRKKQK